MKEFHELAELALGPTTRVESCGGMVVSAPHAVVLAAELVRARAKMEQVLPTGSMILCRYGAVEEDRFANRLIEGVTLYVLFPKSS